MISFAPFGIWLEVIPIRDVTVQRNISVLCVRGFQFESIQLFDSFLIYVILFDRFFFL